MEQFVNQMAEKVGIDKGMAEKVCALLKEQSANVPAMLKGDTQALTPMLSKLGLSQNVIDRIVTFLKEHSADVQKWMSEQGGGILQKAKDFLGGIMGGGKESK